MIHGLQPGPLMFEENARLMYGVYGSLIIASFFLLIIGQFGLRIFCKAVEIPASILYPVIIFTCIMGSYLGQSSMFDVIVMLIFGVIGYFMRKFDFSYVAFLIGFILAPEWERALPLLPALWGSRRARVLPRDPGPVGRARDHASTDRRDSATR